MMQKDESMKELIAKDLGYGQESLGKELKENLKTTFFGGYSKKSVSSYLEMLKDTIEQMHANMEQQVNDVVREKTELAQGTTLLRQQLQDTELLVKENQEQIYQIQAERDQLRTEVEKSTGLDEEKERLLKELEEENENYKKMEELLHSRMEEQDKLFDEKSSLKVKLQNMEKETEQLGAELREKQSICEDFEQRLREAEIRQPTVLAMDDDPTRAEMLARVNQLEREKKETEKTLMTMKELLEDMRAKEIKKSKDAEEEKDSYDRLQQKFNQLYEQSQDLRVRLKKLEQERRAVDTILEKYQRQETEYILLKQNNESYLEEISKLEESIRFMFEQMNQQSDTFRNLAQRYEDSSQKIQNLVREKTDMQLRNVELIEQLNQQMGKIAEEMEASHKVIEEKRESWQKEDDSEWETFVLDSSGYMPGSDSKTVNIGEIKKRSMEMTNELKERLNKQIGGV